MRAPFELGWGPSAASNTRLHQLFVVRRRGPCPPPRAARAERCDLTRARRRGPAPPPCPRAGILPCLLCPNAWESAFFLDSGQGGTLPRRLASGGPNATDA